MPTATAKRDGQTQVSEATRFVEDSSRRSAENARAAVEATRGFVDDTAEVRRKLFEAWATTAETAFQSGFDLYNASLASGLSIFDTATTVQRGLLTQWQATAGQAQQAALQAFQAQLRAASRAVPEA